LSGASMPSDEIMVAQLGPRPLLGGAILARPRDWGATIGRAAPRHLPDVAATSLHAAAHVF